MNSDIVDSSPGGSENFEEAITTQTHCDDLAVFDSYRDKGKEGYPGT